MGLAASQARFLAITSRKMNCEFQSMQIAQQKLSVTRDMQKASQEYQNALSATKLVWDCDTVDNDIYDLSYEVMMQPSAINEYDAYLITDTQGKIVLNEKTFQAAYAAGIIDENGDPTGNNSYSMGSSLSTNDGSRNAFLYQLGVRGVAEASTIQSIIDLGEVGYTESGVGGEIFDKTLANVMNTTAFLNYMKTAKYEKQEVDQAGKVLHNAGDLIYEINIKDVLFDKGTDGKYVKDKDGNIKIKDLKLADGKTEVYYDTKSSSSDKIKENMFAITKNGTNLSESQLDKLTLGDILTGKYELAYKGNKSDQDDVITKLAKNILDMISKTLGYNPNVAGSERYSGGLAQTEQAKTALEEAYNMTTVLFNKTSIKGGGNKNLSGMVNQAQDMNSIIEHDSIHSYAFSITNMAKSFLTYFAIAMEGYDCGLMIDKESRKNSNYVTDYPSYNFQIKNEAGMTERGELNADFYNQLYNQICMNGACSDKTKREMVEDKSYLHNALKNGQLFVSTLNTDGYFYQGHYTASAHIAEVTDEAAVAQAEIQYNVTKSKLNYKEETLELQMKNLDTEISALSTEYETVKGLISKGVEKVFTMFSS